jgi:hypothetical protein
MRIIFDSKKAPANGEVHRGQRYGGEDIVPAKAS